MVTTSSKATPATHVTGELRYTMGLVCKETCTVREIDALSIYSGAEPDWWLEPKLPNTAVRVNQVNGWFEGIQLNAPEREADVLRDVCGKLLASAVLESRHRDTLTLILSKLDGISTIPICRLDRYNLHPSVEAAAGKLFDAGHFCQAVLDTYIALNVAVKEKVGRDADDAAHVLHKEPDPFAVGRPK